MDWRFVSDHWYGTNFTGTTATITGLTPGTYEEWTVAGFDADGNVSGWAPGIFVVNPAPKPAALSQPGLLSGLAPAGGGGFQFTVQASAVQTTLIQATTNLADPASWVTIATNPPGSNVFNFTDTNASQFPARYYRVVSP